MLDIFICEDQDYHRELLQTMVERAFMIEDLEYTLHLVTANPQSLLDYVATHNISHGIYFLDIELDDAMNGIQLGAQLRQHDDLGRIIYVTSYEHYAPMTFKYKVEAFDYIMKSDQETMQQAITQCVQAIGQREAVNAHEKEYFIIKDLYRTLKIDYQDIYYFTTTDQPHLIQVIQRDGLDTFYSSLKDIDNLSFHFFKVHHSYIVNLDNVISVDTKGYRVYFDDHVSCPVSTRKMKALKQALEQIGNALS